MSQCWWFVSPFFCKNFFKQPTTYYFRTGTQILIISQAKNIFKTFYKFYINKKALTTKHVSWISPPCQLLRSRAMFHNLVILWFVILDWEGHWLIDKFDFTLNSLVLYIIWEGQLPFWLLFLYDTFVYVS